VQQPESSTLRLASEEQMAPTSLRRDVSVGSKATGAAMTEALPVFPEQQTSSEPVGMSQTCQQQTLPSREIGVAGSEK
jgi:hypothetical protein